MFCRHTFFPDFQNHQHMTLIEISKVYDTVRETIFGLESEYKKLNGRQGLKKQKADLKKQIKQTRRQLTTMQSGITDQHFIQRSYTRQSGRSMNESLLY